jgi:hypothetical protein
MHGILAISLYQFLAQHIDKLLFILLIGQKYVLFHHDMHILHKCYFGPADPLDCLDCVISLVVLLS